MCYTDCLIPTWVMSSVPQLPLKFYKFLQTMCTHTHTHTHIRTHFCLHIWILNISVVVAMVDNLLLCQEKDIFCDAGPTYYSQQHIIPGKSHCFCTALIPVLNRWKQDTMSHSCLNSTCLCGPWYNVINLPQINIMTLLH